MRIAFSTVLRRPGCVIVQAALGGTVPNDLFEKYFPAETWLTSPTDDMQVYKASKGTLEKLSVMARHAVDPSRS